MTYTTKNTTAILVFTRTAASEAHHKRFQDHMSFESNKAIANILIQKTIKTVIATGLPYFIVDDLQQEGQNFNERLTNATQSIYDKGFENVIIIGNDCPALTPEIILKANRQLEQHPIVLGPAKDGGVYLIGLQNTTFHPQQFSTLPWLTSQLTRAFLDYAGEAIFLLPLCADIDQAKDLQDYLLSISYKNPIKKQLKQLLGQFFIVSIIVLKNILLRHFYFLPLGLRAPPFGVSNP